MAQISSLKYTDIAEVKATPEELYQRGAVDFNFFAGLCIPGTIRFPFPPLYVAIWTMLVTAVTKEDRERVLRYAIGLPRGFAKTTFLKIVCTWLIVYDKVNFLLIVGATEPLARNFLSDLNDILASSNIEAIYGAWTMNLAIDNAEEKKCAYRRRIIILKCAGAGTAVRGINLAYARPDFLLCDDMQTKENADSETESAHLLDWFVGTLLKVVDPFFATIFFSGNMYPRNCILAKLRDNPYWTSLITGAILQDQQSLWEEVHPLKALYAGFKHDEALGRAHIWFAEMMNQPLEGMLSLLPDGIIPKAPLTDDELIPEAGFIIIDPAGLKKTSDDNVINFHYTVGTKVAVVKMICGAADPVEPISTPREVINATIRHAQTLGIRIICIEGVAYQATLAFWFGEILKEHGLQDHFFFLDLSPKGVQKERRITNSVKNLLEQNWYFADPDARQRYIFQALNYKIGKPKQKDDILDACAYIEEIRQPENWTKIQSVPLGRPLEQHGMFLGQATPF